MLEVRNLNAWLLKTKAMKARVEGAATGHVQDQTRKIFKLILKESPQYSGDFVANWNVVTNLHGGGGYAQLQYAKDLEGLFNKVKTGPGVKDFYSFVRYAGHPEAIAVAWNRAEIVIPSVKWNTKLKFVNSAPVAGHIATGDMTPQYRPVHQHLQNRSFISYIKQRHGMGWIG